jgi:hypothetical protein
MTARHSSRHAALAVVLVAVLTGCAATPKPKDYTKFLAANPRSILILPVVNNSVDVTAPDYFLSTVPVPVAERGYYVFPVNLVKRLLEDDGLADAALVHQADPMKVANLFGADAILYITIQRWDAKWVLVSTSVTVDFAYVLKDGKTGVTLWEDKQTMQYSSDSSNGLLSAIVNAAITKASPNYMPLARSGNAGALTVDGRGFPIGPYRPDHGLDIQRLAQTQR